MDSNATSDRRKHESDVEDSALGDKHDEEGIEEIKDAAGSRKSLKSKNGNSQGESKSLTNALQKKAQAIFKPLTGGGKQVEEASCAGKNDELVQDAASRTATVTLRSSENKSSNTNSQLKFGPPRELHFDDLSKRSRCYIISNRFENFPACSLIKQYEIDEQRIGKTFSWLNFDIKVKRDLVCTKMDEMIRAICERDHSEEQCIALFILSHGTKDRKVLGADGVGYDIESIIDKLHGVETLSDKPKLIFIQACRGMEEMKVVNVLRPAGSKVVRVAKKSNTFVYYSTMQGNKAYCSTVQGSFFIYALCEVLQEYYKNEHEKPRYHFGDVVTRVNDYLSTYIRDFKLKGEEEEKVLVQVSEARSSLGQRLYFYPNRTTYEKYLRESNVTR